MARYLIIALALIVLLPLIQGMFTMHARQSIATAKKFVPATGHSQDLFLRGCLGVQW